MASALIIQAAIGVPLFNGFILLIMFLVVPMAAFGVIARLFGARKSEDNSWVFDITTALGQGFKYALYHLILIGGWLMILDSQGITSLMKSDTTSFAHGLVMYMAVYCGVIALFVPWFGFMGTKISGKVIYPPSTTNIVRLFIWNFAVFFAVYMAANHFGGLY